MQQYFRYVPETHDSFPCPLIIFRDERLSIKYDQAPLAERSNASYAENDKRWDTRHARVEESYKTVDHAPVVTLVTGQCTWCIIIEPNRPSSSLSGSSSSFLFLLHLTHFILLLVTIARSIVTKYLYYTIIYSYYLHLRTLIANESSLKHYRETIEILKNYRPV